jgi:hypothetical protein
VCYLNRTYRVLATLKRTAAVPIEHLPVRIIDAMLLKSVDTLRAVRLLYRSGLPIQAQALIRIPFEVRVDIELFMRACAADPAEAAHKVTRVPEVRTHPACSQSHVNRQQRKRPVAPGTLGMDHCR